MLINKGVTPGEVVTIKVTSGAEICTKLVEETLTTYKISKPMVVNITQQGIALMPYVISVSPDVDMELAKHNVVIIAPTEKPFADGYLEQVSGIKLV